MDTLRIFFATWNVATKSPDQDLNSFLDFPSQYNKNKPLPDFYVIGLQEVKSQPQNLLMDSLFSDPWSSAIKKILCRHNYIIAKSIRLQGILLLVFTQMKHLVHLRDIEAQYTKTGFGGMWGNKGAVSVRFNIYGCSVALVNCHLTAHDHLLAERINDYNTIIKQHTYHVSETSNILFHDYVFWIGDLNFRMDHPTGESPSSEQIVESLRKVEKDKYTQLLRHDQLKAVMESGEAFSEFREPEIQFPPTYKLNIGSDDYDIKRKPSWTDRILYKVSANNYENVTLRADVSTYNSNPHYSLSDHKPVIAQYSIKVATTFASRVENRTPPKSIRMRSAIVNPGVQIHNATVANVNLGANIAMDEGSVGVERDCMPDIEEEAFSNYTVKTVEFAPMSRIWYIGDADFRTQITLSPDVEVNPNDWIGIYDANFESLDEYIAYEYFSKVSVPQREISPKQSRSVVLSFPVGSGVRTPGFYRFIYFSQPSSDVRSVLGISDPFEVSCKEDLLVTLDPCLQPTTSSNSDPSKASTSSYVFTDFTALDVANLSKHFANDLSID